MKDFYIAQTKTGYQIFSAEGVLIADRMLDNTTAQIFLSALNNLVIIFNGSPHIKPETIAEMFFGDLADLDNRMKKR